MSLKPAVAKAQEFCSIKCAMSVRVERGACRQCGAEIKRYANSKSRTGKQEFCSITCSHALRSRIAAERDALARIASSWRWRPSPLLVAETAALCRIARYVERPKVFMSACECGEEFIARRGGGLYKQRCDNCLLAARRAASRVAKSRRRSIERGARADSIDPIRVFDRDGWCCHLCGRKTPKALRGTYHDRAPELDHIVALADGGDHTWGNVACACRACNAAKGAKSQGQLGLGFAA